MKICSKCKEIKTAENFYRSNATKVGLFSWCIRCCCLHQKKYILKARERSKRYRKLHPEMEKIWKSKNPEKIKIYDQRKYRKNKAKHLQYGRNRRARVRNAKGSFSYEEWEELKDACEYKCMICEKQEPEIKLTADHIVPLCKGGTNFIENILPLCFHCNVKKGTKDERYYIQRAMEDYYKNKITKKCDIIV